MTTEKAEILIVEDENSVARFLYQALEEAGYSPTACGNGKTALELAGSQAFDLILLDIMLPGLGGIEVCRGLRERGSRTPVMMVTARDATNDKIQGLDAGADDYIVKPFVLKELLARVRALLRRTRSGPESDPNPVLTAGRLSLNSATLEVWLDEEPVSLSGTEFSLLEHLVRHQDRVVPREELLEQVWQYDFNGDSNVLHVYISYLRSKLEGAGRPKLLQTVRGVGYRLLAP